MRIDKQFVILCFMILCLCFLFFMLGYYAAYSKAVNYANQIIIDNKNAMDLLNAPGLIYKELDLDNISWGEQNG